MTRPAKASHSGSRTTVDQSERRNEIAAHVMEAGEVSVEELAEFCGVSIMTVYRDVAVLESAGVVHRNRGKVVASASGLHEATARYRLSQESPEKEEMARAVAPHIAPGSSVLLDDSTSGVWVLRELKEISSLSVVTNSLLVASELQGSTRHSLLLLGGEYQAWAAATMGPLTIRNLEGIHADVCVISASGVRDDLVYHPYDDVAAVKSKMMEVAEKTILLLDHTKFKRRALHAFGKLTDIDLVVVDSKTDPDDIKRLQDLGVEVLVGK
ncbi:MAG: DeoR/GlpR family DNA-binding transcription regulator [Actinomycetaceae bacterium]|nr:DeoR/GlpR family DNA-binding transcription regulator [Actinomycetaceae bacterium]